MEPAETAQAAIAHIRDSMLKPLACPLRDLTGEVLWRWRHRAHVLKHFVSRGLGDEIAGQIDALLTTSGSLWRLITEHEAALAEIGDYRGARSWSAASDLMTMAEEYISGEDRSVRDVLFSVAAFALNWKSNTMWVNAGFKSHRTMAKGYLLEIQDEIWEFLQVSSETASANATPEHAQEVGRKAEQLMSLLSGVSLPTDLQVVLLVFLYQWILKLRVGRLLMALEGIGGDS